MGKLKNNNQKLTLQFSKWNEALTKAGVKSVSDLYLKIHDEIRKNPVFTKKAAKANPKREHSKYFNRKITNEQRKKNAQGRIEIALAQLKKVQKK